MKPLVALLLALCLTAQADPADRARGSAGADIATTGIGLALGAIEANPAGLLTLPLKLVALDYAAKLPEGERQQAQITLGAVWTGATVNNVCVIVAIATVGAFAPACLILGVAAGVQQWGASAAEREFWGLCARERVQVPDLICTFM